MACIVVTCVAMAHLVMAYIVMAYIDTAQNVMIIVNFNGPTSVADELRKNAFFETYQSL